MSEQAGLWEHPAPDHDDRRLRPGQVVARPRGVFWARTGQAPGAALCEEGTHEVYAFWFARPRRPKAGRGHPGEAERVLSYGCAVCWPEGGKA